MTSMLSQKDSKRIQSSSAKKTEAKDRHVEKLIQQCEEQCHMLATSTTDPSLIELRSTIWCWPPPQPPTLQIGNDDAGDFKKSSSFSLFTEPATPSPKVSKCGLIDPIAHGDDENNDNTWLIIPSKAENNDGECEILFQLVIADLDVAFIRACREYFLCENKDGSLMCGESGKKGGGSGSDRGGRNSALDYGNDGSSGLLQRGVRIMHQPIQQAIADSLREINENEESGDDSAHTFVVFGSYGTFPTSQNDRGRGLMTGLCKSCIAPLFPSSWENFASQCGHQHLHSQHGTPSRVWISSIDEIPDLLTLVSCEAYPRNQYPSEEEAAAQRWEMALEKVAQRVQLYPSPSSSFSRDGTKSFSTAFASRFAGDKSDTTSPNKYVRKRKVRVITQAMGSFVGHLDVSVFARGLSVAMDKFCSKYNAR